MCGGNTARRLRLILARGVSGPVASPGHGFQPVDPTGAISSPGPKTRETFVPALDPQTKGDFALPLDTYRPRLSQPWTAPEGAFVPALDPQTEGAFRAPSGHPSTRLFAAMDRAKGIAPWNPSWTPPLAFRATYARL